MASIGSYYELNMILFFKKLNNFTSNVHPYSFLP